MQQQKVQDNLLELRMILSLSFLLPNSSNRNKILISTIAFHTNTCIAFVNEFRSLPSNINVSEFVRSPLPL